MRHFQWYIKRKKFPPTSDGVEVGKGMDQYEMIEPFHMEGPFSAVVSGPSGAGKSYLIADILRHEETLIHPRLTKITWCYDQWQPLYSQLSSDHRFKGKLSFVKGIPQEEMFTSKEGHTLVVSDDLQGESSVELLNKIFTKRSHHTNTSFILCVQNIFLKTLRTATLNAHYIFIFKNPRDTSQIATLSQQMYPKRKGAFLKEAYQDATALPHSYICINLKQNVRERERIRTNIIPGETQWIYFPA